MRRSEAEEMGAVIVNILGRPSHLHIGDES